MFGLLTLSVWLGLAMSTRLLGVRRQKALFGWHRTLVWTALWTVVLHAVAVLLDPVLHFGLPALLSRALAPWKPVGVAAGVVAGWLTLALAASFRAKRWMGHRAWRFLHYASFGAFVLFLGHALTVGTDLKGLGGPCRWPLGRPGALAEPGADTRCRPAARRHCPAARRRLGSAVLERGRQRRVFAREERLRAQRNRIFGSIATRGSPAKLFCQ